ncbi:MAG: maleylacetoacetate isomerase [Paracoccaceae bacterium]
MTDTVLFDFWRSSASYRLRIALNLAGIDYRAVPVDLPSKQHKTDAHMARNPQGLVPVLDIDGHRFTQSLAILDYLDETRGLGLLPADPVERAHARALAHSVAVDVHPVCNLQVAAHAVEITGREEVRQQWMQRFITPGLQAFEALLARWEQAPFCTGAAPGLADICLMPQLYNADRWQADYADCSRIRAVKAACEAHPAFAAAHPDRHKP